MTKIATRSAPHGEVSNRHGDWLAAARKALGWDQTTFAAAIGVSQVEISRKENNYRPIMVAQELAIEAILRRAGRWPARKNQAPANRPADVKEAGILTPSQFRDAREIMDFTQAEFGVELGLGKHEIHIKEKGRGVIKLAHTLAVRCLLLRRGLPVD